MMKRAWDRLFFDFRNRHTWQSVYNRCEKLLKIKAKTNLKSKNDYLNRKNLVMETKKGHSRSGVFMQYERNKKKPYIKVDKK